MFSTNRIIAAVAAVLVLAGAGYLIFVYGAGGDRVSGEELRSYVEQKLTQAGATFEAVTYEGGSDTVVVTNLDARDLIPFYKEFKIARVEIKGGDKNALELLLEEEKAKAATGDKYRRVAKTLRAENVTFTLDASSLAKAAAKSSGEESAEIEGEIDKALGKLDARGSVENLSINDYSIKPTGETLAGVLTMPEGESAEALKAFMVKVGKFARAQKYGRYEIKNLKYKVNMEEATVDLAVESMASDSYDAGAVGKSDLGRTSIIVAGSAIEEEVGGPVTATVESAVIESMDMAKMLAAMEDGSWIPENPDKAPLLSPWAPTFGDYKVLGIKVSVPKLGDFALEELSAQDVQNVAGLTLGGKGELKNLEVPAAAFADGPMKPVMDALGAKELRVNVSSVASFDEKAHVWDVSKFVIDVDKFGSLNTQFRFGGLAFLKEMVGMPSNEFVTSGMMNRVLQEMTFVRLQLTYRDQGVVDYMLNSMAEQSGMERGQLVQQYVQQLDALRQQFGDTEALKNLSAAVTTFLNEPKSLTLTFQPKEPVPLAQISAVGMAAPAQLLETLNFSAEANK